MTSTLQQRLADDAARQRARRAADPGSARAAEAAWRDRLRARVFRHYGRACACCGALRDLTVDHAGGGGEEHRRELFGVPEPGGGIKFYRWLAREGFPDGYQVLCMECNQSKGDGRRCLLHRPLAPSDYVSGARGGVPFLALFPGLAGTNNPRP